MGNVNVNRTPECVGCSSLSEVNSNLTTSSSIQQIINRMTKDELHTTLDIVNNSSYPCNGCTKLDIVTGTSTNNRVRVATAVNENGETYTNVFKYMWDDLSKYNIGKVAKTFTYIVKSKQFIPNTENPNSPYPIGYYVEVGTNKYAVIIPTYSMINAEYIVRLFIHDFYDEDNNHIENGTDIYVQKFSDLYGESYISKPDFIIDDVSGDTITWALDSNTYTKVTIGSTVYALIALSTVDINSDGNQDGYITYGSYIGTYNNETYNDALQKKPGKRDIIALIKSALLKSEISTIRPPALMCVDHTSINLGIADIVLLLRKVYPELVDIPVPESILTSVVSSCGVECVIKDILSSTSAPEGSALYECMQFAPLVPSDVDTAYSGVYELKLNADVNNNITADTVGYVDIPSIINVTELYVFQNNSHLDTSTNTVVGGYADRYVMIKCSTGECITVPIAATYDGVCDQEITLQAFYSNIEDMDEYDITTLASTNVIGNSQLFAAAMLAGNMYRWVSCSGWDTGDESSDYELIDEIITGYTLLLTLPDDWTEPTGYLNYYTKSYDENGYPHFTQLTEPQQENSTFLADTYYRITTDAYLPTHIYRNSKPNGEMYDYDGMIIRIDTPLTGAAATASNGTSMKYAFNEQVWTLGVVNSAISPYGSTSAIINRRRSTIRAEIINGRLSAEHTDGQYDTYLNTPKITTQQNLMNKSDSITSLYLTCVDTTGSTLGTEQKIPRNIIISVYGMKKQHGKVRRR